MYEPHRSYPLAALCVLCLALCADFALASGVTGGWGDDAPPASSDNGYLYGGICYRTLQEVCDKSDAKFEKEKSTFVGWDSITYTRQYCKVGLNRGEYKGYFEGIYKGNKTGGPYVHARFDYYPTCRFEGPEPPKPPESGGGGDFAGGGASDSWEEDPKKPDEDKKDPEDPEDPKDSDPDFGDLGDIPKPPVPPPTPPASGPNVNVGVGVNVPEPCTGAAAGTVGCMKPGEPTGEKPKPKDVNVPKQLEKPVSHIKGCPDPKYFDLWDQRYELSYDQFCAQAPLIKPYVIFSATLAAFFITLSAFRRK